MISSTFPAIHVHSDQPCQHDLRLCTGCGNVYCAKCNKEWVKKFEPNYTITTSGTTVYTAADANQHSHQWT